MLDAQGLDDPEVSALKDQLLSLVSSRGLLEREELSRVLGWDAESYCGRRVQRQDSELVPESVMKSTETPGSHPVPTIPFTSFSQEERETFQWLCRVERKNPDDFKVEGREHAPDCESARVHRDVVVRYLPTGKGRRYCPDYGTSWIVKFVDDLEVHYFAPDAGPQGLIVWS